VPKYRRLAAPGGTYFFTVCAHRRQPLLTDPRCLAALREAIRLTRLEQPFTVLAWVVLPDHLHCVWRLPPGDADFSSRWSNIKRRVSQACRGWLPVTGFTASRQGRRESTLWQRRYWEHLIRDEDDLARHLHYIHANPVRHGYAQRAVDWPHSTFHAYVRRGVYGESWGWGKSRQRERISASSPGRPWNRARGAPYGGALRSSLRQGRRMRRHAQGGAHGAPYAHQRPCLE